MKRVRGNTLVGLLVTIAIIAILMVVFFKGSGAFGEKGGKSARPDGRGETIVSQVKLDATDDVCRSDLQQVRSALQIAASSNDDKYPETLQETKLPASFYKCPIGGEPYRYDPSTGTVTCPHPGHEKY